MNAWLAQATDDLPHVTPIDDLRPHIISAECWCRPFEDDGVIVHNSLDQRETFERGRKPS